MKLVSNISSLFSKTSKKKKPRKSISKNDPPSFNSSSSGTTISRSSSTTSPRTVLSGNKITKQELEHVLRSLGLLEDEMESIVDDITFEELGAVGQYDEFLEEMREAFGVFDRNGDGKISAEELRGVLVILGEGEGECGIEECRKMIESVDSDGDGFVSFDDFVRMMEGQR